MVPFSEDWMQKNAPFSICVSGWGVLSSEQHSARSVATEF